MTEHSIGVHPGLQAERTDLSWMRTGLALTVNGALLLLRHDLSTPGLLQQVSVGVAFALAVCTLGIARRRKRVLQQRPLPERLADPMPMLLLGIGTTVLGVMTFAVVLTF